MMELEALRVPPLDVKVASQKPSNPKPKLFQLISKKLVLFNGNCILRALSG